MRSANSCVGQAEDDVRGAKVNGASASVGAVGFRASTRSAVPEPIPARPSSGGRLGSDSTRSQNKAIATEMESRGWTITGGGGRLPEEYIPGPGGARKGSAYPDITATKNGRTLRVQTVDTLKDGKTPDARERRNAKKIRNPTDGHYITVPK